MSEDGNSPAPLTKEELKRIPDDLRGRVEQVSFEQRFEMIQSPLLPPEVLARYDNVIPGLASKLIEWTEAETAHRRELERESFAEARSLRSRAQLSGVAVSIFGTVAAGTVAVFSAIHGSFAGAFAAAAIVIASVGGPVAARILAGRWSPRPDDK